MTSKRMTFGRHYVHGVRGAIRHNAPAFAFSIMITSSYGMVATEQGSPDVGDIYAFMVGAVLGFVVLVVLASAAFRNISMEPERGRVLLIASALAMGSTAIGLGLATAVGALLDGLLAWGLAPFAGCIAFVLGLGLEFAIAEEVEPIVDGPQE